MFIMNKITKVILNQDDIMSKKLNSDEGSQSGASRFPTIKKSIGFPQVHATSEVTAGRLLIVSNRLPVTILKTDDKITYEKSVGGLVAGFGEIYQNKKTLWIGHCGIYADEPGYAEIKAQLAVDHLIAVDIPKKT